MSQADPFRDIVKQNVKLYRDSEEQREISFQIRSENMKEWKKDNEIYIRAAKCFSLCEHCDLTEIGIFDDRPLEKHVDNQPGLV